MALIVVNLTDTFNEWREKTNNLSTNIGDLSLLTAQNSANLVAAMNGMMDELSDDDKLVVGRARKLQKFMSQPFFVAEQFTGKEGRYVSLEDTISSFEAIIKGEMDEYNENDFAYVGSINEVVDNAKKK